MTMLEARHLTVAYGGRPAVRDVSFVLPEHGWLMLTGPNGAGKTSIVSALAGRIPYEGAVLFDGQDLRTLRGRALARKIGVLSQNRTPGYAFTVEEVVRLGRYAHEEGLFRADAAGRASVDAALDMTGLADMRRRSITELSGGEQQRVFLAQVFAQDPEILILDEPANHLDLVYQKQVFSLIGEWLARPGKAVISVVHDLSFARVYGTSALLLDRGSPAACGEIGDVFRPEILADVYGMDVSGWMRELLGKWGEV